MQKPISNPVKDGSWEMGDGSWEMEVFLRYTFNIEY